MAYQDYDEFIAALNAHGARILVIGAHAVALHARPRATENLDLLIEPTRENATRVLDALKDFFGGADLGYTEEDVLDRDMILQLGVAPVRIDMIAEIPGVKTFEEAWEGRVEGDFRAIPANYIGLEALIRAKEAADGPQDRADVKVLRRVQGDEG